MKKVSGFCILLMVLSILIPSNLSVSAAVSGDYTYTLAGGEATLTKYSGSDTDIVIPAQIDGYPVVAIGRSMFSDDPITSVVFPDSVRTINKNAFKFCHYLTSVTFGEGLETIDDMAFYECIRLKTLVLPPNLKSIGSQALVCASSLNYLFIPESVTTIEREGIGFKRLFIFENDDDPFTQAIDGFVVYGTPGSAAQDYAESNGFEFTDAASAYSIDALGASLRTTSPGMRFGFDIKRVNAPAFDSLYSAEYGFLYALAGNEEQILLENAGSGNVLKTVATNFINNESDMSYNLVFTEIPKSAYDTKISARAYAVINGITYYSDIKTYCVNDVLNSILNDDTLDAIIKENVKTAFGV